MNREELSKYIEFMCNPENEYACDECPENIGSSSWQNRLPCGQQHCWVTMHCKEEEEA